MKWPRIWSKPVNQGLIGPLIGKKMKKPKGSNTTVDTTLRRKAEELLKNKAPTANSQFLEFEMLKLIHESDVH